MVLDYRSTCGSVPQDSYSELAAVFDSLDDVALLERLQQYRWTGRKGYSPKALWRAYVASFHLNLPHTNALIRRLNDDSELRSLCGFGRRLPHRSTFNRFIQRLSYHVDLVEGVSVNLTNQLQPMLPGFAEQVAIDSTTVRTHSHPHRKRISDPEASWTAKTRVRAKEGKDWCFGYKVHMIADVDYGIPLAHIVTTAKRGDTTELSKVVEHAESLHPWFKPKAVVADKGYDSMANHTYLLSKRILPVIHIRRTAKAGPDYGFYTEEGTPTCLGQVPMEYVRSDPTKGRLYRCRADGCHLAGTMKGGITHCDAEVWEDPRRNIRLFGAIRRDGPEWQTLYSKRQAIERVFKSMKESRRLERHCVRGLQQITLHSMMSTLSFQATALVHLLAGEEDRMRWMVKKVA